MKYSQIVINNKSYRQVVEDHSIEYIFDYLGEEIPVITTQILNSVYGANVIKFVRFKNPFPCFARNLCPRNIFPISEIANT